MTHYLIYTLKVLAVTLSIPPLLLFILAYYIDKKVRSD